MIEEGEQHYRNEKIVEIVQKKFLIELEIIVN